MTNFERKEFMNDNVLNKLHDALIRIHQPAEHTKRNLAKNIEEDQFMEIARAYVVLGPGDKNSMYVSYDVESQFTADKKHIAVKIINIQVYKDEMEYHKARLKSLNSVSIENTDNVSNN